MRSVSESKSPGDIIFVSLENWDEVWRRNQFLCAGLASRFPEIKILFVGLARDVSNDLRHGRAPQLTDTIELVSGHSNIWFTRPIKLLPNTVTIFRKINEWVMRLHTKAAAKKLGMKNPMLWLNPQSAVHMVGHINESAVIYDITDDWTTLTQSDSQRNLTIAQDAELCKRADSVIVCSERLFEMKRELASNLNLIPNGVDSEHYKCVLDGIGPLPQICQSWKHPVLGYVGTIHPDRVDIDLIESTALRLPTATIALVGPTFLKSNEMKRLQDCENVIVTGPQPYAQIPEIMRAFDVCITPHLVTPFTESLNPIKLWEYLAAGKPIVSTDVAGFRDYSQFVEIAKDATQFADKAIKALSEGDKIKADRRSEAIKNSWDSRLDSVLDVIRSCDGSLGVVAHREVPHAS